MKFFVSFLQIYSVDNIFLKYPLIILRTLTVGYNNVTTLGNFIFKKLRLLQKLALNNNMIQLVHKQTFYGLISLNHLDLSFNRLFICVLGRVTQGSSCTPAEQSSGSCR